MSTAPCLVPEEYLPVYYEATRLLDLNEVPHLLGGGLIVSLYGRGRETKDIDFYIRRRDAYRAMTVLNAAGFFAEETEKPWLLKAEKRGAPVDLIVHSTGAPDLSDDDFAHARVIWLGGYPFRGFGPEDILVRKIYAWHEGRPDWWDAVSIIHGAGREMDWDYFVRRVPPTNPARALSLLLFAESLLPDGRVPRSAIQKLGASYFGAAKAAPRLAP